MQDFLLADTEVFTYTPAALSSDTPASRPLSRSDLVALNLRRFYEENRARASPQEARTTVGDR